MSDTDEAWRRVAQRIGVWPRTEQVEDSFGVDHVVRKPLPDPSDPAMIVAMIEWCLNSPLAEVVLARSPFSDHKYRFGNENWEHKSIASSLVEVLIDGIDKLTKGKS